VVGTSVQPECMQGHTGNPRNCTHKDYYMKKLQTYRWLINELQNPVCPDRDTLYTRKKDKWVFFFLLLNTGIYSLFET
jgi:hypothetical protein